MPEIPMPEPTTAETIERIRDQISSHVVAIGPDPIDCRVLLAAHDEWRETAQQYNAAVNKLDAENNRLGDRAAAAEVPLFLSQENNAAHVGPAVRILADEVPLDALADLDDGQDATVTARVAAVRSSHNKSAIPTAYAEIEMVDPDSLLTEDPDLWPVTVPPAVWATAAYHLRLGAVVTAQIHKTTADNGVPHLFLVAVVPESGLEWTGDDEQHNDRRKAVAFEGGAL